MVRRYHYSEGDEDMRERDDGEYVDYDDYAKLEEALRECVHQIECVRDYYPIHPVDQPKLAYALRAAYGVLGEDAKA